MTAIPRPHPQLLLVLDRPRDRPRPPRGRHRGQRPLAISAPHALGFAVHPAQPDPVGQLPPIQRTQELPDLGQRRGLRLRRVQPGAERLPDGPATTTGAAIRRNRPLMDNLMDKTVPPTIDKPSSPQTRDSLSPPNAHVRAVFGQQLQPVVHRRFAPRSVVRHGGTEGPFAV